MKFVRIAAIALTALAASPSFASDGPKWSEWGDDLFARAQAEQRFVILDLRGGVVPLVPRHGEDDLRQSRGQGIAGGEISAGARRPGRQSGTVEPLRRLGWPATIVFGPDGTEIAKIKGYIEPERMQALLKAIIDDPSPGPSVGEAFEVKPSASAFLGKEQRAALMKNFDESG